MEFDPALYIQALNLILDTFDHLPRTGMSKVKRQALADKIDAARSAVAALESQKLEDKTQAMENLGKATDEDLTT